MFPLLCWSINLKLLQSCVRLATLIRDICCTEQGLQRVKNYYERARNSAYQGFGLEIDRYIGLPIFFPIFKHFTIIGYRFCKKKISVLIFFFFFFFTYIIIQSITSSEILFSAFDPSKCTHTWRSGHTHTHTHLEQWALFTQEMLQHNHRM